MRDYIGLPTGLFADQELAGSKVRLLVCWPVGPGTALQRGECFTVAGVERRNAAEQLDPRGRRWLQVTNARAKRIPVEADCLELLFPWPANVRGHHDGGK